MSYNYQNYETIDDMIAVSKELDQNKHDYLLTRDQIAYTEDGDMIIPREDDMIAGTYNDWSLSQACGRLDIPASYLQKLLDQGDGGGYRVFSVNMSYWNSNPNAGKYDSPWLVRMDGDEIRGVVSQVYSKIGNTWMLQTAKEILSGVPNYTIVRPYVDSDRIDLKIQVRTDENRGGGNYAFGVYISNGEVGNRNIHVSPFIQRHSCTNSIVMQEGAFIQRHAHKTVGWMEGHITETMGKALQLSAERLNDVMQAEMNRIPSVTDVLDRITKQYHLTQETRDQMMIGSEGANTHMGVVNALAYAAYHEDKHDDVIKMEELAGAILVDPDSVFATAEMVDWNRGW